MSDKRIALVTGGNRGIGLEICRQLASKEFRVYLGARDAKIGTAVVEKLVKAKVDVHFIHLDVTDETTMDAAKDTILQKEGKLDVLVNNAGVLLDPPGSSLDAPVDMIRTSMETNVYGPFRLCQLFIPSMKRNKYGRIVNISSGMGQLDEMGSGYPGYRVSKTALNALTKIFSSELQGSNVLINTMAPGWVRTDMGGENATRSVEEGADTAVWLATLPDGSSSGVFFKDRKQIAW
ncbi:MAG: SDR family oxidoreductase [Candidatus Marinimicrobia bacterium]|nr:SDR family oxidoreductase [Candidatus Neomarinimicrobiota bacterium]